MSSKHSASKETSAAEQESGGSASFSTALGFVDRVKTHYVDQIDVYTQFIEILQEYQQKSMPIVKFHEKIRVLFSDSPELQADFEQFLPVDAETPAKDAAAK